MKRNGRVIGIQHELDSVEPGTHRAKLASYVEQCGITLYSAGRYDEARDAKAEADLKRHHANLASYVEQYGVPVTLHHTGRVDEACKAKAESLVLQHQLHKLDPDPGVGRLRTYLRDYAIPLRKAGRDDEAHSAEAEMGAIERARCTC